MNAVIAWFAGHRVAANLLMLLLVVSGFLALPMLDRQFYPPIPMERIKISIVWPGAGPADVEAALCIVIEDAIFDVEGIKSIESHAMEGRCVVEVDAAAGVDSLRLKERLAQRIDAISGFPEDAGQVTLEKVILQDDIIDVALYGDLDVHTLHHLADQINAELSVIPEVSRVERYGARDYELAIEVSKQALNRYRLTFDDIVNRIRSAAADLPGGTLKTPGGDFILRTRGGTSQVSDFEKILLRTGEDGSRLRLGEVAEVVDGFSERPVLARFDGKPAVFFSLFAGGQVEATSRAVERYVEARQSSLPQGAQITTWLDDTAAFGERASMLSGNALGALALVFLVLFLFMRAHLAFWVSAGLAVAFLGAFAGMWLLDLPLSMMTMFAFLVVLGIVVDDGIIVAENIYAHQGSGQPGISGAIKGTQQIAGPVVIAAATTIMAFLPGLFLPGQVGEISRPLPLMVIIILSLSLIEALLILPAHLRKVSGETRSTGFDSIQKRCSAGLDRFIHQVYAPFLHRVLGRRFLTLSLFVAVLLMVSAIVAGGWIRFTVMPEVDADHVGAVVRLPHGTPFNRVEEAVEQVETALRVLRSQMDAERAEGSPSVLTHVQTTVQGNEGRLTVEINPLVADQFPVRALVEAWRERIGDLPAAVSLDFNYTIWEASNQLMLQVTASELDLVRDGSRALKQVLAGYPGVYDIRDSYAQGKTEIQIGLRPEAVHLGITLDELARQVRQGFRGTVVKELRRGHERMNVVVRYPPDERQTLQGLKRIPLELPNGARLPFSAVATLDYKPGFVRIDRVDRRRSMTVRANVDPSVADPRRILEDLRAGPLLELEERYPSLRIGLDKRPREEEAWLSALAFNGLFGIIGIYLLLALFFQSYLQPLLVMLAIPFGVIGAVLGHLLLGISLTANSLVGMAAAAGVVVNDSLVLIDCINTDSAHRSRLDERILAAGVTRFRPIVLTSLTTFAGLVPIMLETSTQAKFVIPMAVSLAFGVLFATVITLILIPVCYSLIFGEKR